MSRIGPILIFALLIAPGVRLLLLTARTRQAPEFWGGIYFAGLAIGVPLRIVGATFLTTDRALADTINSAGHVAFASGTIAMAIFTCIVFRRSSPAGRIVAGLMIAAIIGTSAHTLIGGFASVENSYSIVATNFARLLPTFWAFSEATGYWRAMRRREALGLADPVLTNRFLLWSIWTGSLTLIPMVPLVLRVLGIVLLASQEIPREIQLEWTASGVMVLRVFFIVVAPIAAVALSLSFFPPAAYLDRIRARSAQAAAGPVA